MAAVATQIICGGRSGHLRMLVYVMCEQSHSHTQLHHSGFRCLVCLLYCPLCPRSHPIPRYFAGLMVRLHPSPHRLRSEVLEDS